MIGRLAQVIDVRERDCHVRQWRRHPPLNGAVLSIEGKRADVHVAGESHVGRSDPQNFSVSLDFQWISFQFLGKHSALGVVYQKEVVYLGGFGFGDEPLVLFGSVDEERATVGSHFFIVADAFVPTYAGLTPCGALG